MTMMGTEERQIDLQNELKQNLEINYGKWRKEDNISSPKSEYLHEIIKTETSQVQNLKMFKKYKTWLKL